MIVLVERVAEGVHDGFEIVDDFLGREPVPAAEEVSPEVARLDADDLDAQVLDLVPQALGNADDGEFGGAVEPTSNSALPPGDGAHVGDHAGLMLPHVGENGAGDGELAENIGVEMRFDFLVTDFFRIIFSAKTSCSLNTGRELGRGVNNIIPCLFDCTLQNITSIVDQNVD